LIRDASLELKEAEARKRVTEAQKDLVAKRNKCFTRTEPLGRDRYQSSFFHFDHDKSSRVWAERDLILGNEDSIPSKEAVLLKSIQIQMTAISRMESIFSRLRAKNITTVVIFQR